MTDEYLTNLEDTLFDIAFDVRRLSDVTMEIRGRLNEVQESLFHYIENLKDEDVD